jgi:hypothetical protein
MAAKHPGWRGEGKEDTMKRRLATLLIAAGIASYAARAWANPTYSIASNSGSVMYTDLPDLNATYLVFQVTKNSVGTDTTVWAQLDTSASSIISNVGTGQHQISAWKPSTGAHGSSDPAPDTGFDQGETKGAFFLVKASATTNTNQALTVNLFSTCTGATGPGCAGGSLSGLLSSATFQFTVEDTLKASANQVNTVITIPNNPTIGLLGKITVTGCTNNPGSLRVLNFSPVSADTWPADAFEFIDSDIQIDGYAHNPYRDVALIPSADVLENGDCAHAGGDGQYDEIFSFVINAVGNATTTPANFVSSGGQVKHTTNSSGSFSVSIPPPGCGPITVSSNPNPLNDATVGAPYSGTITASPAPLGDYTFSASGLPGWLSLDVNTGALSGTPTFADVGAVSFTVIATDSGDPQSGEQEGCTGQAQFSFDVGCPTITVSSTPSVLPHAVAGTLYSATFSASPAGTYTFSASGLPGWLTLDPTTGALSGTPTNADAGPVAFTVTATESTSGCTGDVQEGFPVDPVTPVAQVPALGGAGLALLALSLAGAAFLVIRRG